MNWTASESFGISALRVLLVATALHKENVGKQRLWKLVLSCKETGIQLIGTQSDWGTTARSKDASLCQLTSQNTISSSKPFHSKSFLLLTRLLQATKQAKFASDAQESRKQNKIPWNERGNEYIIQKVKRFFITTGRTAYFLTSHKILFIFKLNLFRTAPSL